MAEATGIDHNPQLENSRNAGQDLKPAVWLDLVIYLVGGIGIYLLSGIVMGFFFTEINLTVTVLSAVLNFLILAGSVYVLGIRRRKLSWVKLGLNSGKNLWRDAAMGAFLAVAILPRRFLASMVGMGIEWLVTGEFTSMEMRTEMFSVGFDTWYGVLLMLIGIGILAPIAEELFFRGLLYDFFRQKTGVIGAILISSTLFGLAHYDSLAVMLSAAVMGMFMAMMVELTRSLKMSIWMHIFTNSMVVLLIAIMSQFQNFFTGLGL